jgi:acyl-CoA synthetase (AMP-forming)/AMP-acid ligase II
MTRFRNLIEALAAAPGERPFVTAWINEDEQETVTFAEFRRRARCRPECSANMRDRGDRVIIIMPQGILR